MRTQPDKYVEALVKMHEMVPSDCVVSVIVGDEALFGEVIGLSFEEMRARAGSGQRALEDKSALAGFTLPDLRKGERLPYYMEILNKAN